MKIEFSEDLNRLLRNLLFVFGFLIGGLFSYIFYNEVIRDFFSLSLVLGLVTIVKNTIIGLLILASLGLTIIFLR